MRNKESKPDGIEKQSIVNIQDEYFTIKSSELGQPSAFTSPVDLESEKKIKQRSAATDSFLMTGRDSCNESRTSMDNFESNRNFHPGMKKRVYTDEELLFARRIEGSERNLHNALSECNIESSVLKTQKSEDWFVINQSKNFGDQGATIGCTSFDGEHSLTPAGDSFQIEKNKKDVLVDDSFMVQDRSVVDQCDSQWRTDVSMVSELTVGLESAAAPWTPEIDYGIDISFPEADKKSCWKETNTKPLRGPLVKTKPENMSRIKKPSAVSRAAVQKSELEKEEENRKKMEELLIQRQQRIAERSASTPRRASSLDSKTTITSTKHDKKSSQSTSQETKKTSLPKTGITCSTIDCLASGEIKHNELSSPSQPRKTSSKVNGVMAAGKISRITTGNENKKHSSTQVRPLNCGNELTHQVVTSPGQQLLNGGLSSVTIIKEIKADDSETKLPVELSATQGIQPSDDINTCEDIKEQHEESSSIMKDEQEKISQVESEKHPLYRGDLSLSVIDCSLIPLCREKSNPVLHEDKMVSYALVSEINAPVAEKVVGHLPITKQNALNSTATVLEENVEATNVKFPMSPNVSEKEITCSPVESILSSANGMVLEPPHKEKMDGH
ncbi:hypothetical protein NE237_032145 [Protea cynaroides]|uniref:Uncharacterized protein n=1 Tax=Protea cynaroides TaxID=273540 RepID=A0A9Q0L2K2_9MAGN|nr:hypothetical protein NE237_032145 [Protea cynaroides]